MKTVNEWLQENPKALAALETALRDYPEGGVAVYLPKTESGRKVRSDIKAEILGLIEQT